MRKLQSDCNILCVRHSLLFLFCVEYDFSQCVAPTVYGTVKYRQHGPQWQQCLGQFSCQFHLQVHLPPSRPWLLFYLLPWHFWSAAFLLLFSIITNTSGQTTVQPSDIATLCASHPHTIAHTYAFQHCTTKSTPALRKWFRMSRLCSALFDVCFLFAKFLKMKALFVWLAHFSRESKTISVHLGKLVKYSLTFVSAVTLPCAWTKFSLSLCFFLRTMKGKNCTIYLSHSRRYILHFIYMSSIV